MPNVVVQGAKTAAKSVIKFTKDHIAKEAIEKAVSVGADVFEKYNNRIKIPDLKDVSVEDAVRNLNELNLLPITAMAKPNVRYADTYENMVVNSEPKFGKKVDPKATVKLYYVTNDVISKSKELEKSLDDEFKLPRVVGLNIYEAREDLEELGLRVILKLENPNLQHINREDGQVTRVTYPDNKKLTPKQKKGERVWLYYVDENVIKESLSITENMTKRVHVRKNKILLSQNNLRNPFKRKKRKNK